MTCANCEQLKELLKVACDDDLLGKRMTADMLKEVLGANNVEIHKKRSNTIADISILSNGEKVRVETKVSRMIPALGRDGPKFEFNYNSSAADVFVYWFLPMIAAGRELEEYTDDVEEYAPRKVVKRIEDFRSVDELRRSCKVLIWSPKNPAVTVSGSKLSFYTSIGNQRRKTWYLGIWVNADSDSVNVRVQTAISHHKSKTTSSALDADFE